MCYVILTKDPFPLPTMVNKNSHSFCDLIQSGYEILQEGTKREIECAYDELVIEFASNLD